MDVGVSQKLKRSLDIYRHFFKYIFLNHKLLLNLSPSNFALRAQHCPNFPIRPNFAANKFNIMKYLQQRLKR